METRTLKPKANRLPKSYVALVEEFPLMPILSGTQYDRAAAIIDRLALREGKLDSGEAAYLEVLEGLVERFDDAAAPDFGADVTPTEILQMLCEQAGMGVSELGKLLGSKSAASELLSGKRKEPSKAQIRILCGRFRVDASLFLLPPKVRRVA